MNNIKKPDTPVTTLSVRLDSNDVRTLVDRSRVAGRILSDYVRWLLALAVAHPRGKAFPLFWRDLGSPGVISRQSTIRPPTSAL